MKSRTTTEDEFDEILRRQEEWGILRAGRGIEQVVFMAVFTYRNPARDTRPRQVIDRLREARLKFVQGLSYVPNPIQACTSDLCLYETGETLRKATFAERRRSQLAAQTDGGAGVIRVDGQSCYVEE